MNPNLDKIFRESYPPEPALHFDYFEGVWLPTDFAEVKEEVRNYKIRDDDVFLCGYPKTGTTWTQEMIWCVANGLDSERISENIRSRFPGLETRHVYRQSCFKRRKNEFIEGWSIEEVKELPGRRFIKTHLPYHLLPNQLTEGKTKAKIIYCSRNAKDACISHYYFQKLSEPFLGTLEDFCELYLGNKIYYAPFWDHVIGFWNQKDSKNILFLKYEDMKADLGSVIRKTASFLGKTMSDDQVNALKDHLNITNMRSNLAVNLEHEYGNTKFIRKGEVDGWKEEMSDEMIKRFDDWTTENLEKYPELKAKFL